ncbi:MAG: RimK family alpha-L-glutamate ligase, partial [Bacteroidetes bacterium]|nr:RimK family alpha-L-glutamate ligase [Bacteroidota bacterium]
PTDVYLYLSNVANGYDAIYNKDTKIKKTSINAIIPRIGTGLEYGAAVIEHFNKNLGIFSCASGDGLLTASNKMKTSQRLSQNKVRVPKTIFANQPQDFKFLLDKVGGLPCIAKLQAGSQGAGVMILNDELAASTSLQSFSKIGVNVILQEKIDTEKPTFDIRAYVVGDEVVAAYKRFALDDDFRSNYSLSKQGEKIKLTDEEIKMAIDASKAVGLKVSGVDLMRDIEGKPYCIEVNGNASLKGIETVTGIDIAGKIIDYIIENYKKSDNINAAVMTEEKTVNNKNSIHPPQRKTEITFNY